MAEEQQYAMVAINMKQDEDDNLYVRRVLIAFNGMAEDDTGGWIYLKTRLLAVDPYFTDPLRSHVYEFTDDGYRLVKVDASPDSPVHSIVNTWRPYHINGIHAIRDLGPDHPNHVTNLRPCDDPLVDASAAMHITSEKRYGFAWEFTAESEKDAFQFFYTRKEFH